MTSSQYPASGADLVLLHGLNNTPALWRGVEAVLPAHIRPHAPMLPAIVDLDLLADALLAALPPRFWLAGFSFGGYVSLAILARAPQRVQGLALICTSALADTPEQQLARRAAVLEAASGCHAQRTLQGLTAFHPDHRENANLLRARREMVEAYGAQTFIAHALACLARPDRTSLLHKDLPLLWVAGSADPLFPPPVVMQMRDRVGHGQFREIDPAGHLVPLEQPRLLASALTTWID